MSAMLLIKPAHRVLCTTKLHTQGRGGGEHMVKQQYKRVKTTIKNTPGKQGGYNIPYPFPKNVKQSVH